ncbi:MAG: CBS domain-containing protein, partial [Acidobacteriota bacterium]|nr:CBS domain-containing protein [Acidobacteriota bacterium]
AIAAPVLAAATNSPMLFAKQLWRETRIALFQQSIDTRSLTGPLRESTPRVSFGRAWIKQSALEIFQEDLARFKVIMTREVTEDPFECLQRGIAPQLQALRLHNGTVYRWNRPCYGISDGKPHLRIENRVLPAGPTPLDEIANAAFWFGLLRGIDEAHDDITRVMDFEAAHENFIKAARLGMAAHLDWPGRRNVPVQELILEELLPLARVGLGKIGVDDSDIDRYLEVIEERTRSLKTGSRWIVDSFDSMRRSTEPSKALAAIVAGTIERQLEGAPVHTWSLAELHEAGDHRNHYERVEHFMTRDLFTVHEDDLVDVAAYVMDWKHIRHVPVEDNKNRLVGLITHRSLLRLSTASTPGSATTTPVSEIMRANVITARPETTTLDAMRRMRTNGISCLPVVQDDNHLVGIVTERDFMRIAIQLLEDYLRK